MGVKSEFWGALKLYLAEYWVADGNSKCDDENAIMKMVGDVSGARTRSHHEAHDILDAHY